MLRRQHVHPVMEEDFGQCVATDWHARTMRWTRVALAAVLAATALWWASPPARACSCDRRPLPNVVFEGIAVAHASAPHGWENWTFEVLQRGLGPVSDPMVVRVNVSGGASCGLNQSPTLHQRYRVETPGRTTDRFPPIVNLCAGALVPLAAGEEAFPTVNDGDGAAGWPAMLAALGAFAALLALARATRRATPKAS